MSILRHFRRARRPIGEELNQLPDTLSRHIMWVLKCCLLIADPEHPYLDLEPGSSLDYLQAASIDYRIAIGPHGGCRLHAMSTISVRGRKPL